jgi:hypothetical protein
MGLSHMSDDYHSPHQDIFHPPPISDVFTVSIKKNLGLSRKQYTQHLQQFDNLLSTIEHLEVILKNKGEIIMMHSGKEDDYRFRVSGAIIHILKQAAFTRYDDLVKAGKQYLADTVLRSHGIQTIQ